MYPPPTLNEFVVKFANVNGSGSASANNLFARAIFRMGIPVAPRNIFPSNIQGLPTWYEVRVSERGYLGARGGVDLMVAMNAQTLAEDVASLERDGYLLHDASRPLAENCRRDDIHTLGIPISSLCLERFGDGKERQLLKNIVYVGALAALLDIELAVLETLLGEQFRSKEQLLERNHQALVMGYDYAHEHLPCPLPFRVRRSQALGQHILVDGNTAIAIGCVYGGATLAAWYPITPSTSVVDAFERFAHKLRRDPVNGKLRYAVVQAEDELAAIGMVVGGAWNGARAFTATSGPGISLMSEFLGLAYFAEIPAVIFNIQRAGPSTGMPTRTQQADLLTCAYASHGDTKQVLLFPRDPHECFQHAAAALDLADRLQTPVLVLSDLEIGMNDWVCEPFQWDDERRYDRGKVLDAAALEHIGEFARYEDVDGDGITYRSYPGTHAEKGAFFTRGSSRTIFARYTENGADYVDNVQRLLRKFRTAAALLPAPQIIDHGHRHGLIYIGSTAAAIPEVLDILDARQQPMDAMRICAFPFNDTVYEFIKRHEMVFVVEQNRDAQLRTLLINEGNIDPAQLTPILHYDGTPITARFIVEQIGTYFPPSATPRLPATKVKS